MTGSSSWVLVKHMHYAEAIRTKFVQREGKGKEREERKWKEEGEERKGASYGDGQSDVTGFVEFL